MDVEARRSRRRLRRGRAGPAVRKLPGLYLVREPEAAAASNVIRIGSLRPAAALHLVWRSWPLQHAWRDLVRGLMRKPTP